MKSNNKNINLPIRVLLGILFGLVLIGVVIIISIELSGETDTAPNDSKASECIQQCPTEDKKILKDCVEPDQDGSSRDSLCNSKYRIEKCGGKYYCCPSDNGKWTEDLVACDPSMTVGPSRTVTKTPTPNASGIATKTPTPMSTKTPTTTPTKTLTPMKTSTPTPTATLTVTTTPTITSTVTVAPTISVSPMPDMQFDADFDESGLVDIKDFVLFVKYYQQKDLKGDLNTDQKVDILDFQFFRNSYLSINSI